MCNIVGSSWTALDEKSHYLCRVLVNYLKPVLWFLHHVSMSQLSATQIMWLVGWGWGGGGAPELWVGGVGKSGCKWMRVLPYPESLSNHHLRLATTSTSSWDPLGSCSSSKNVSILLLHNKRDSAEETDCRMLMARKAGIEPPTFNFGTCLISFEMECTGMYVSLWANQFVPHCNFSSVFSNDEEILFSLIFLGRKYK